MGKYLRLMRVHHYIKNLLIFAPVFFSGRLFDINLWIKLGLAFVAFCMATSVVYILNDIRDVEKDRLHPTKCKRPMAANEVTKKQAAALILILMACICSCVLLGKFSIQVIFCIGVYIGINILYSFGLKNYPVVDIAILTSGFLLRLLLGSAATGIVISDWLYLTVTMAAMYLALGKRRNEKLRKRDGETRTVLKYYSNTFLNSMMYMCLALTIVFYSLWTMEKGSIWTVPIVLLICMKYCMNIEQDSDGDPVDVLLHDKVLLALCVIWVLMVAAGIYQM